MKVMPHSSAVFDIRVHEIYSLANPLRMRGCQNPRVSLGWFQTTPAGRIANKVVQILLSQRLGPERPAHDKKISRTYHFPKHSLIENLLHTKIKRFIESNTTLKLYLKPINKK